MTNPTCEFCGVEYREHLGLIGTCRELQEQRKLVAELAEALRELRDFSSPRHYRSGDRSLNAFQRAAELLRKVGK